MQAKSAHLRPQIARKSVGLVDLVGARRDLVVGKAPRGVAKHIDVFAKPEIEALPGIGDHARSLMLAGIIERKGKVRPRRPAPMEQPRPPAGRAPRGGRGGQTGSPAFPRSRRAATARAVPRFRRL